jgi:hypothetical protein
MDNEFRVSTIKSRLDIPLDITGRFQQTPKYEAQLSQEVSNKLGFVDGDLIEIHGNRTTAARVISIEVDGVDGDSIGLNNLMRNNARVSLDEIVTIRRAELKIARRIVLAPIGKRLKKSELLKIVAKKSFLDTPFVEGDVTYLRSKIMRYLLGSVTWMRVVKTDPEGVIVATEDTDFEVVSDPIMPGETGFTDLPDLELDDDFSEKDFSLDEGEWAKINTLLRLGLFNSRMEVITFFLREGIQARSDIFEKSGSVLDQLNQLKINVKKAS